MKRRDFLAALILFPCFTRTLAAKPANSSFVTVFGRLPAPNGIQRVFAAGSPASVLTYVLAPDKLLGWPLQLDEEARTHLAPAYRDLPFLGRLSGRGGTVPLESLLAMKPDLILDVGTVDAAYLTVAERRHRQTGIPYVLIDGRLADVPRQLDEVGRLLGVTDRAGRLAAQARDLLAPAAASRADEAPGDGTRVYFARGPDGLETGLTGSINAEVIEAAGGINVASAGSGRLARVSFEQLLTWAPDLIITQDAHFYDRACTDSLWMRLPAVKAGRIHLAPHLPFGWLDGPAGVNRLIGVRWLAELLGDKTPDPDFPERVAEFYRLFYGRTLEPSVLQRLLIGT